MQENETTSKNKKSKERRPKIALSSPPRRSASLIKSAIIIFCLHFQGLLVAAADFELLLNGTRSVVVWTDFSHGPNLPDDHVMMLIIWK